MDFKKKSIRITKDYVRVTTYNQASEKDGTELIVQEMPKSTKSNRVIHLQDDVFKLLMFHYQSQQSSKYPNPMRHTFATRLVEQQVPLRIIQELLGHASVTTTMRYAHALEAAKEKAVSSMDAFINLPGRPTLST